MRKFVIAALIVAVVGVAGYFGLDAYARGEAERQVATVFTNIEAGGVKADHGKVDFNLFARRLDIAGIKLAAPDGGGTTTIARVTASGFSPPSDGRVKAARIEIADIAFEGPNPLLPNQQVTYRIPLITIEDYEGPERIDTAGAEPWQLLLSFLEGASASTVSLASFNVGTRAGTDDATTTTDMVYGATRLVDIAGGRIATVTVEPSTFTTEAGGKALAHSGSGEIGRMSFTGMDIAAAIALGDAGRRAAQTSFRTLYDGIEIDGYKSTSGDGTIEHIKKITLGKVAVRPAAVPVDQFSAFVRRIQEERAKGETISPDVISNGLDTLTGLYGAVEFGPITVEDATMQRPGVVDSALKALRIGAMKNGRFDSIALEGFASATPAPGKTVTIDRFALLGLNFAELMQLSAEIINDPDFVHTPAYTLGLLRILDGIEATGITVQGEGTPDDSTSITTFQFDLSEREGPIPRKFTSSLRMSGSTEQLAADAPMLSLLADSGMKRFDLDLGLTLSFDDATRTLTVATTGKVADAFSGSYTLRLSGLDDAVLLAEDDTAALQNVLGVEFAGAEFTLTDAGIYQMQLKKMAADQDATPEAVQEMVVGFAQIIGGQVTGEHPELTDASKAIIDFLSAPKGTLSLKITPKGSVPATTLVKAIESEDPASALELVGVEATTSR